MLKTVIPEVIAFSIVFAAISFAFLLSVRSQPVYNPKVRAAKNSIALGLLVVAGAALLFEFLIRQIYAL